MTGYNANNERIKRQYLGYLKEAKRLGEPSVDAAAGALDRFELYTKRRDFKLFHVEQAIGFKNRLTTLLHWTVSFVGRGRSERTVTQQQIFARQALDQLGDEFSPTLSPRPGHDSGS